MNIETNELRVAEVFNWTGLAQIGVAVAVVMVVIVGMTLAAGWIDKKRNPQS